MAKTLTTEELLNDRSFTSNKAANKCRDKAETHEEAHHVDMKSYYMGESIAYTEASKMVRAEMKRLMNLWQNRALTADDFGV